MEHFTNDGYGWNCKHCRDERVAAQGPRARFFTEGEAEDRDVKLAAPPLARWRDETRRVLCCPRCGVAERVSDQA